METLDDNQPAEAESWLYSIQFEVSVRNFSRQTSGTKPNPIRINGDTTNEFLHDFWAKTEQYLKRKVVFVNNVPEWHENLIPEESEIDEFITLHDKKSKTIHHPGDLTRTLLNHWKTKQILMVIHIYSTSVDTAAVFKSVQDVLIKPFEKDRSNAISHAALNEIVSQLKSVHEYHYVSHDINWLTWASYIVSQDAHLKETLINSPPPVTLIELFRYAPTNADRILNDVRRNLGVASSVNKEFIDEVMELQVMVEKLREVRQEESRILEMIETKLESIRLQGANNTTILGAMNLEMNPDENELSAQAISQVVPQNDIDHL